VPADQRTRPARRLAALIAGIAIALAGCGTAGSTAAPEHDLMIETAAGGSLRFLPEHASANAARLRVLFRNVSTEPHNLTFQDIDARTDTIVAPGGSQVVQLVAPGPGVYRFLCTIHPGMGGDLTIS
jgi:plastocyanin